MPPTRVQLTNDHAAAATSGVAFRVSAPAAAASRKRPRWERLGLIRAFVVGSVLTLMVASAVAYGANVPVDLALAVLWTALVALVWEVGARALAHLRREPGETG